MVRKGGCSTLSPYGLMRLVLFVCLLLRAGTAQAGESLDWDDIEKAVAMTVQTEQTDVATLAKKELAGKPLTAKQALLKVCLLMQAGMNRGIVAALKELKTVCRMPNQRLIRQMYLSATEKGTWAVAQAVAETFQEDICGTSVDGLLRHFQKSGWSFERVDQWLAARSPGRRNFWIKRRLAFQQRHGREEALAELLGDRAKANPQDSAAIIEFLDILRGAEYVPPKEWLSWLPVLAKPKRASEACAIGIGLADLDHHEEAVLYLRLALRLPLTEEEAERLRATCSEKWSAEQARAAFAVQINEALVKSLVKLGREEEAEAVTKAAARLRKEHGLGSAATEPLQR